MEQETEHYRLRDYVNRERNADKLDSGMTDHPDVDRKFVGSTRTSRDVQGLR